MKKEYNTPILEIIKLEKEDILTISGPLNPDKLDPDNLGPIA